MIFRILFSRTFEVTLVILLLIEPITEEDYVFLIDISSLFRYKKIYINNYDNRDAVHIRNTAKSVPSRTKCVIYINHL